MAEAVYALCALTSIACTTLLLEGYRRSKVTLLLWAAVCFVGLAVNNILLFVDLVMFPTLDLRVLRSAVGLVGMSLLVFGLVWEER